MKKIVFLSLLIILLVSCSKKNEQNIEKVSNNEETTIEVKKISLEFPVRISSEDLDELGINTIDSFDNLLNLLSEDELEQIKEISLKEKKINSFKGCEKLKNLKSVILINCEIQSFEYLQFLSESSEDEMYNFYPKIGLYNSTIYDFNSITKINPLKELTIVSCKFEYDNSNNLSPALKILGVSKCDNYELFFNQEYPNVFALDISGNTSITQEIFYKAVKTCPNVNYIYIGGTDLYFNFSNNFVDLSPYNDIIHEYGE